MKSLASFPGSPLAPTKNKNRFYFLSGRGESLGTRLRSPYICVIHACDKPLVAELAEVVHALELQIEPSLCMHILKLCIPSAMS